MYDDMPMMWAKEFEQGAVMTLLESAINAKALTGHLLEQ
jgi:hypothetical protein